MERVKGSPIAVDDQSRLSSRSLSLQKVEVVRLD
jgi:hypothetical protein